MNNHSHNHDFSIERNIPVPPKRQSEIPAEAWPFEQMRPGDSFLVPCDQNSHKSGSRMSSVNHAIRIYRKKRPDREFTCRTVVGGVRCWRIA